MSEMTKETLETITSIAESLRNIERAMLSQAQANIAGIVYPPDAIQSLLSEYKSFFHAWKDAHQCVKAEYDALDEKFGDSAPIGHLKLKFGDEEANRLYEGVRNAEALRNDATSLYDAFRKEHPIIDALYTSAFKPK